VRVERDGLGYRADIVGEGISLSVDRIVEARGETWAELTVERAPDGHLMCSRVSLTGVGARQATARYLSTRSNGVDWAATLETLFLEVLRRERTGDPVMTIGKLPPRLATEYLLEPMLAEGKPTILYGAEGGGKSTLATAIAVSVATGVPCLSAWKVGAPRKVLILDWESNHEDWNDLIAAMAFGIDLEPPEILYRGMAQALTSDLHTIARIVTEHEVALVIIDSVGLASPSAREGADANDAAIRLFSALRHLHVTSLLIDHVSKSADAGADSRPYGSVYKPALARATYEIRAAEEADPDGTRHIALFHRKDNTSARRPPMGIRVKRDQSVVMLEVEPVRLDDERIAKGASLIDRIADILREGAETVDTISAMVGADPGVVRKTLSRKPERFVAVSRPGEKGKLWGLRDNRDNVTRHVAHGMRDTTSPPLGGREVGVSRNIPAPGKWDMLQDLKPGADGDGEAPWPAAHDLPADAAEAMEADDSPDFLGDHR